MTIFRTLILKSDVMILRPEKNDIADAEAVIRVVVVVQKLDDTLSPAGRSVAHHLAAVVPVFLTSV